MGSSYSISCKVCDYSKNFKVGIGMMYSPSNLLDFDNEFALIPNLIRSKKSVSYIKKLVEEKNVVIADNYRHAIYHCPKCSEFYERFFIHLDYENGSFEVEYKCTKCKTVLETIGNDINLTDYWGKKDISLEKYKCPRCGNFSLFEGLGLMIMWD